MPEVDGIFHQVAALLIISAIIAVIASRLRQPLIVGFIGAGILVGPEVLGLVEDPDEIELFAKIGIALLLFVVGLKLDVRLIRVVGPVALAAGLGQVIFTSAIGYLIAIGLGMGTVPALYVAVALTFSSTIIIVKLLSDKDEIDDLHGRIAIGFLIVQDIVVVLVMIGLSATGGAETEAGVLREVAIVFARGLAFLATLGVLMRWVLPPVLHRIARSPELLILFAIAWAVFLAAAGDVLGFSEEVGAFLAGVALASTPYRDAISSRLVSLRDFLLLFFFIALGAQLDFTFVGAQIPAAVVFSLFVLIGNPLIVMIIMGFMGYHRHVSFRCGLVVAQISEFSLILAALGLTLGHIDEETVGLITLVGLVTIGLSTYLIYNSDWLYDRIAGGLRVFQRGQVREVSLVDESPKPQVIVFGLGRYGKALVERLMELDVKVMGVDFDPQALDDWHGRIPILYGDAEDPDLFEALPLRYPEWVVCTVRRLDTDLAVASALRERGYRGKIALTAYRHEDVAFLEAAGPDRVLMPYADAADEGVAALGLRSE